MNSSNTQASTPVLQSITTSPAFFASTAVSGLRSTSQLPAPYPKRPQSTCERCREGTCSRHNSTFVATAALRGTSSSQNDESAQLHNIGEEGYASLSHMFDNKKAMFTQVLWTSNDLFKAWTIFTRKEMALSIPRDFKPSHLVQPQGSFEATIIVGLHFPTFQTAYQHFGHAADETNSSTNLLLIAGLHPSRALWLEEIFRRLPGTGHDKCPAPAHLPDELLALHRGFRQACEYVSKARVSLQFGTCNRENTPDHFEAFTLNFAEIKVVCGLCFTDATKARLARIVVYADHPMFVILQSFVGSNVEAAKKMDIAIGLAAAIAGIEPFRYGLLTEVVEREAAVSADKFSAAHLRNGFGIIDFSRQYDFNVTPSVTASLATTTHHNFFSGFATYIPNNKGRVGDASAANDKQNYIYDTQPQQLIGASKTQITLDKLLIPKKPRLLKESGDQQIQLPAIPSAISTESTEDVTYTSVIHPFFHDSQLRRRTTRVGRVAFVCVMCISCRSDRNLEINPLWETLSGRYVAQKKHCVTCGQQRLFVPAPEDELSYVASEELLL